MQLTFRALALRRSRLVSKSLPETANFVDRYCTETETSNAKLLKFSVLSYVYVSVVLSSMLC